MDCFDSFELPRNVLDRLHSGAVAEIEMKRVAITLRTDGDALLVVKSEAGGGF